MYLFIYFISLHASSAHHQEIELY